ncbi:MAG: DJ-1/PfpI family protein [Planctomycetota bacterium]|nr:DJ-1/PfpI family protein [Planctomycetota bacterium]
MDIVIYLFDGITALDAIGPYEVLTRLPGARVRFVGPERGTARTDNGALALVCDAGRHEIERADILLMPGGFGTRRLEHDAGLLEWVQRIDRTTSTTMSVCTGAMVLAAAGLLEGREATTHWVSLERLSEYGAIPRAQRVVTSGKYLTAAGVSAGIDMALEFAARTAGAELAMSVQLGIEYDPAPPFDCGSVQKAPPEIVESIRARFREHS